jgi:hypothetical protein
MDTQNEKTSFQGELTTKREDLEIPSRKNLLQIEDDLFSTAVYLLQRENSIE